MRIDVGEKQVPDRFVLLNLILTVVSFMNLHFSLPLLIYSVGVLLQKAQL